MVPTLLIYGAVIEFSFFGLGFLKNWRKKALYKLFMSKDINGADLDYKDEPVHYSELRSGDHIYIRLRPLVSLGSGRGNSPAVVGYHHGVFLGTINGKSNLVVDFGRANRKYPVIESMENFMGHVMTTQIFRRTYVTGYIRSVEEVIHLANEMNGCSDWGRYEKINNNCETFASYLKTGKAFSSQAYTLY